MDRDTALKILMMKPNASKDEIGKRYSIILKRFIAASPEDLRQEFGDNSLDKITAAYNMLMGYDVVDPEIEAEEKRQAQIDKWVSWGLKSLGIILLFILALTLIRTVRSRLDGSDILLEQPTSIRKVEEQLEQIQKKEAYATEDEEIKKIMKDQPEVAAQIITNWLDENGSGVSG